MEGIEMTNTFLYGYEMTLRMVTPKISIRWCVCPVIPTHCEYVH